MIYCNYILIFKEKLLFPQERATEQERNREEKGRGKRYQGPTAPKPNDLGLLEAHKEVFQKLKDNKKIPQQHMACGLLFVSCTGIVAMDKGITYYID